MDRSTEGWEAFRKAAGALADPNRLRIFRALLDGPRSVTQITRSLDIRQPLASHHLAVLLEAGLVEARRAGRERRYQVSSRPEPRSVERLVAVVAHLGAGAPAGTTAGAGLPQPAESSPPRRTATVASSGEAEPLADQAPRSSGAAASPESRAAEPEDDPVAGNDIEDFLL